MRELLAKTGYELVRTQDTSSTLRLFEGVPA